MADKKDMKLVMKKENEVNIALTKHWDMYAKSVPNHVKQDDVHRLIFNLMRKPNSKFEILEPKQMINFALDTLEKGYDPAKNHVYPIVYENKGGVVLEAQKGYMGTMFDLEKASMYAQYGFVHESEKYKFDKPGLMIHHETSRKRVKTDIEFSLDDKGEVQYSHELDKVWVIYRDIKTKVILDVFEMYIDDALDHGFKYTKASPIKKDKWIYENGKSKKVKCDPYIDKDNNWIKNPRPMIVKTALLQGAKVLPTDLAAQLTTNMFEDNVSYTSSGDKVMAYDEIKPEKATNTQTQELLNIDAQKVNNICIKEGFDITNLTIAQYNSIKEELTGEVIEAEFIVVKQDDEFSKEFINKEDLK